MNETSRTNKQAWEYRAYEFWNMYCGFPGEKAAQIQGDPRKCLRYHGTYFEHVEGMRIANPCGSNGRIAVPLGLLGADVTIFDISEENKRYALELAQCAGVPLHYEVCDFYEVDEHRYQGYFDIAYMEGGILHYFHDIDRFADKLHRILKKDGKLVLSDSHPFRKILTIGAQDNSAQAAYGDYFDREAQQGNVAYQNFFPEDEQAAFPKCSLRFYTLSEIFNALIQAGFVIREFHEHPRLNDAKIPGEFTIYAENH